MYAIVADGHDLVTRGTSHIVNLAYDCERIDTVQCGDALLAKLIKRRPDLLVLDLAMPGETRSVELVRLSREAAPHARIIVQSSFDAPLAIENVLMAGADGYVRKSAGLRELVRALRTTQAGRLFVPRGTFEAAVDHPWKTLSAAERQVVMALAGGVSLIDFAQASGRAYKTVSNQKYAAMEKLGLPSNSEVSAYLVREGLGFLLSDFPQAS